MTAARTALLVTLALSLAIPAGTLSVGGVASTATTAPAAQADGVNVKRTHPSTDLSTFDAVMDAARADVLDRSEVAVQGDVLVVRLDRAGIGAAIANASGGNAIERYGSWLDREDTSLTFAPVDEDGPVLVADGPGVAVRSGTFDGERRAYLVVETGDAAFAGEGTVDIVGLAYRFTARDGNATLRSDPVTFVEPSVSLGEPESSNGSLSLSRPTADVLGRSSLPPGTPVTVSLLGAGGVETSTTVPLEPPNTMEPDRFSRLTAQVDTAVAPDDARLVVAFANRGYPYDPTLVERNVTVTGERLEGTVTVETFRARGDLYSRLGTASALHAARDRGEVVRSTLPVEGERVSSAFVEGDLLVVRLESERLAAYLNQSHADTPTARFRDYLHDSDAELRVVQTQDTTTPSRQPKQFLLRESRYRVVADGDVRWVLLDTGNASVVLGDVGEGETTLNTTLRPGEAYDVSFEFPGTEDSTTSAHDRVAVAGAHVRFDTPGSDRYFAEPGLANVTVRSTLAPGHEVTVVAENRWETRRQTVVLAGRNETRATARFDLTSAPQGETYGLRLYLGRPVEPERRLAAAAVDTTSLTVDVPTAVLRIAERSPAALTVTGELSRGGTLRLETADGNRTLDTDLLDAGQFESRLSLPTSVTNETAVRVVAYRSVAGTTGGERPYRDVNGDPVSVTLTLDPSATPERTHTPETPPPTDDGVPEPGTTVPASERTSDDGAGFGALAAGVAVLGLALLTRRR